MSILTQKKCTKCGKIKNLSEFTVRSNGSKDGYRGYCKDCDNTRKVIWCANNKEKTKASQRKHYYTHLEQKQSAGRERHKQLRLETLAAYGNKCACCGEDVYEFLSIDHINGGGGKERRENPNTYRLLKKAGFPEGYRVLCHNCNQALGHYGFCPHNKDFK